MSSTCKAKYWLLTIPHHLFTPFLPNGIHFIKGQLELGERGYLHWQILIISKQQCRLSAIKKTFGDGMHAEPSRSEAAEDYVWKESTRVAGTQFELGTKPFKRNSAKDWDVILQDAKSGNFDNIPADVYIRNYSSLKKIAVECSVPTAIERRVKVLWGPTGTGKSRTAWNEAGLDAYPKDPCTKFWDGYRGQQNVVIDEFRGTIGISHLLRWLDRYPVLVEVKGSSVVLKAENIWITSNLDPRNWYDNLDEQTVNALLRRLEIIHCPVNMFQ